MSSSDGSEWVLIDSPSKLKGQCKGKDHKVVAVRSATGEISEQLMCWKVLPGTDLISLSTPDRSIVTVPASYFAAVKQDQ